MIKQDSDDFFVKNLLSILEGLYYCEDRLVEKLINEIILNERAVVSTRNFNKNYVNQESKSHLT